MKYKKDYVEEAKKFLTENKQEFLEKDTDFSIVSKADEFKYKLLIEEKIKSLNGALVDFDGKNCDEPCNGWDGISHRCECGNRRVYWSSNGDFKDMYIYGEAY